MLQEKSMKDALQAYATGQEVYVMATGTTDGKGSIMLDKMVDYFPGCRFLVEAPDPPGSIPAIPCGSVKREEKTNTDQHLCVTCKFRHGSCKRCDYSTITGKKRGSGVVSGCGVYECFTSE